MVKEDGLHIILADDSEIFREGVKSILQFEEGIEVTGEASSCAELRILLESGVRADVVLLDISLESGTDGLDLIAYLNGARPDLRIIILSHYKDVRYIVRAVQNRVRAYLAKDSSAAEIVGTIRAVHQGDGVYFGETIPSELLVRCFGNEDNLFRAKPYDLSVRELDILRMLASGYSVKGIANALSINVNTVESYKERIKNKLGVNSMMEAVVFAVKRELF